MKRKKERERLDTFYYLLGGVFLRQYFIGRAYKNTTDSHLCKSRVIVKVFAF
jgi:hypothetical protein